MGSYAVVAAGLILNMIVASPDDRVDGAALLQIPQSAVVDTLYEWNPVDGFVPPRQFAMVFGHRVEARERTRRNGPVPPAHPGSFVVEILPGDVVSEFRTTWNPGLGFQTVGPHDPQPNR